MHSDKSAVNCPTCVSNNRARLFHIWWRAKQGATAIEYALMAAGISLGIVAIVFLIGDDLLATMYQPLADLIGAHLH